MLPELRGLCNVGTVANMRQGRSLLFAALIAGVAVVSSPAAPAAGSHDLEELEVIVALNAAGDDKISVSDVSSDPTTGYTSLASDVAISMDQPSGSFRTSEDIDGGYVHPAAKLARPDPRGGLSYAVDTGELQVMAEDQGYEAVVFVVCTPQVRQLIDALLAPQEVPYGAPGSRCRGWYQEVDEPAIRATVHLRPDRDRYSSAVIRVAGAAAITFAVLGLGATLLRRGPLRHRSFVSWLLAVGSAVVVAPVGWMTVSIVLWLRGPPADPMLLGGGSDGEQVLRTLLPGLAFVIPALLPAAVLLSAARKPKPPPVPPAAAPAVPMWWPNEWWERWAAQAGAPPPSPPPPPPAPPGGTGWARPGGSGG